MPWWGVASATNLLVVIADDLGADKVDLFADYPSGAGTFVPDTPTIDTLAGAGLAFTNAWATPVCSPTRASLLTGNHPFHHGVGSALSTARDTGLDQGDTTLAEVLRDEGYATGLFGKWHLGFDGSLGTTDWTTSTSCADGAATFAEDANPLLHGFDTWLGHIEGEQDAYDAWLRIASTPGQTTTCVDSEVWPDTAFVDGALDWIGAQGDPWFVVVSFKAPHVDPGGTSGAQGYEYDDLPASCLGLIPEAQVCVAADTCGDSDGDGTDDAQDYTYALLVACMDAQVDTLLQGIDPTVLADTLVVFFGDNGTPGGGATSEEVMEDPYDRSVDGLTGTASYGKGTALRSGVRVPFVVADGANVVEAMTGASLSAGLVSAPGRVVQRQVLVADVYDTVLELLGFASPVETDGGSFAPCLSSRAPACAPDLSFRAAYSETFVLTTTGATRSGDAVYQRGGNRMVMEYSPTDACLYPSVYTDAYDETDRYASLSPVAAARLKSAVRALGVPWMPGAGTGALTWCR